MFMTSECSLQFFMTSWQSHIPDGRDLVARCLSKGGEFCPLTMIFEDDWSRTRAWTWPWLVISDLFPVVHVQTPGGQASLETSDGFSLATRPPSCWDEFWVLSVASASTFFSFSEPTFVCLLIVEFLQVRLVSKFPEDKILQHVVAPSEKCHPLLQYLIAYRLNRSRLPTDKLRSPGTVSTCQWWDHNRLSGCKRHRKRGKWLKSTFSSLELMYQVFSRIAVVWLCTEWN